MEKLKAKKNNTLKNKFRFVILNDETFEEKFSLTLTRSNVWIFFSTIAIIFIIITSLVIVYTPLKYFIPGFGDYNYRGEIVELKYETDSIQKALAGRQVWLQSVSNVLSGHIDTTTPKNTAPKNVTVTELLPASKEEMKLREDVEEEQKFALNSKLNKKTTGAATLNDYHFFTPVKGYITDKFDPKKEHFGIDIAAPEGEPVSAILGGTVIGSDYTLETGNVLIIQHNDDLISVYKHNNRLYKAVGEHVDSGDVIAAVGNSGELSSGSHLHFELWYKGTSVNPKDYIIF